MANKQVLSVVAASILAAAFTFTGCGTDEKKAPASSSSSVVTSSSSVSSDSSSSISSDSSSSVSSDSSSSISSSSSSAPTASTTVKVSDAYVIGATVTIGGTVLEIEADNGLYETAEANKTGAIVATNGINDLNGNNIIDSADNNNSDYDTQAVTLKAPSGYANVNPFTTLSVLGMKNMDVDFPVATALAAGYDFDVVASSSLELDREVLIAALTIQQNSGINTASQRGFLPDPGSSSSVSSEATTSSTGSSSSGGFLPDPSDDPVSRLDPAKVDAINAMSADELTAEFRASFPAAVNPDGSSSSGGIIPNPGESSSSVSSEAASSSTGTSSSGGFLPNPA